MEENLGLDRPPAPMIHGTEASPSAPAYDVVSEKDAIGQRPQTGQPILPQQPGQPVLMGQPAYALPGQLNPVQPVMYTFQDIQPSVAFPRPSYPPPYNHMPLALFTMIICSVLNITSLAIGIPALILAVTANVRIDGGQWKSAKIYSNAALYLSISNLIYTLGIALIILGSVLGSYYRSFYY